MELGEGTTAGLLSNQGEKKYKLLFHNGSFKKKSIKVWYSKAQLPFTLNPWTPIPEAPKSPPKPFNNPTQTLLAQTLNPKPKLF